MRLQNVRPTYIIALLICGFTLPYSAQAGFSLGAASNYAVLFEGAGSPAGTLSYNTFTVNGNFGIGGTGKMQISGGGTVINGNIDFAAANTGQLTGFNQLQTPPTPVVSYSVAVVASALTTVNALSTTLAGEVGTGISIANGTVISAINGTLDGNGNRVFNVTSFSSSSGNTITINGDAAGDSVVLNFAQSGGISFNSGVILNGLTPDQVLYNITGGTLNIVANNQGAGAQAVQGIFLDVNGTGDQINNSKINGRIFGGDSSDMHIVSGGTLTAPTTPPVPEPRNLLITLAFSAVIAIVAKRKALA